MIDRLILKNILSNNLFIYDSIIRLLYKNYNEHMFDFTQEISQIDSIEKFGEFRDKMSDLVYSSKLGTITYKRSYSENTLYGYTDALMEYANIPKQDLFYMPIVEHGIPYGNSMGKNKYKFNNSFIFQGEYASVQFYKESKKKAYFIGPYLLYASSYYDVNEILKLKSKLGKVGLIFLAHSIEGDTKGNINNFIEKITKMYNGVIDTFIICVYCLDAIKIQDSLLTMDNGIKFVSAGFKLDSKFVKRLRSIIEIADVVFYDEFSSSIGYSYYLGKNNVYMPTSSRGDMEGNKLALLYELSMKEDFDGIDRFMKKYWGDNKIKTPQEIFNIYKRNKYDIIRKFGF